jgi:hypothetical protein
MRAMHILTLALVLSVHPDLSAQGPPDEVLAQLRPGQLLRLRLRDGPRVEGRLLGFEAGTSTLRVGTSPLAAPSATIDSLWLRGRATGTGAVVGALVVGLPSFGGILALCYGLSETGGCDQWGAVVGIAVAAAGAGALLGAGLGSLTPTWHLKYGRSFRGLSATPVGRGVQVGVVLTF